jgi:hypothetical protein
MIWVKRVDFAMSAFTLKAHIDRRLMRGSVGY